MDEYGVGPAAVRTIAGTINLHLKLEERLAKFKGVEAAITFQSGLPPTSPRSPRWSVEGDIIFSDQLNHASIIDGCRLSRAQIVAFAHADPADLRKQIEATTEYGRRLIVTDGVFSMDGDIAPLPELYEIAKEYDILLMVDDAHGEGVLGKGGRGIVDHFGLHGKVDVEVGTMSKAFGVIGGVVAGNEVIVDWLRQRGRPFLFQQCAMTVPDAAACLASVNMLEDSTELVDRLWSNGDYFKKGMNGLGFNTGMTQTPIVPVMLGEAPLAQKFSKRLFEEGTLAMAIGFPTVAQGKARIRVMNSASHSKDDLEPRDRLVEGARAVLIRREGADVELVDDEVVPAGRAVRRIAPVDARRVEDHGVADGAGHGPGARVDAPQVGAAATDQVFVLGTRRRLRHERRPGAGAGVVAGEHGFAARLPPAEVADDGHVAGV